MKKKIKSILSNFQFLSLCIVSYYQSKFFVKIQSLNTNSKFLKLIIKQKKGLTCLMPLFLNSTQRHAQPTVNKDQNFAPGHNKNNIQTKRAIMGQPRLSGTKSTGWLSVSSSCDCDAVSLAFSQLRELLRIVPRSIPFATDELLHGSQIY